jgi:hypothetical protein
VRIRRECFIPATPWRSEPRNTAQFSPRMQQGCGRSGDCGQIPDPIDEQAPWSAAGLSDKMPGRLSAADRDRAHQLKSIELDRTELANAARAQAVVIPSHIGPHHPAIDGSGSAYRGSRAVPRRFPHRHPATSSPRDQISAERFRPSCVVSRCVKTGGLHAETFTRGRAGIGVRRPRLR